MPAQLTRRQLECANEGYDPVALVDPGGSGLSEHAVHHFHGLVLDAYRRADAS